MKVQMMTTTALVTDLLMVANQKDGIKSDRVILKGRSQSSTENTFRLGFIAARDNVVEDVKMAFRDTSSNSGKVKMIPQWSPIRSDFSHGVTVHDYLAEGKKITISGNIGGNAVTEVTIDHIDTLCEGNDGDLKISSLYKHVKSARAATAKDKAAKGEALINELGAYLRGTVPQEHQGMDAQELFDHLVVEGGLDKAREKGREIIDLENQAQAASDALNSDELTVQNALRILRENTDLFVKYHDDLTRLADLDAQDEQDEQAAA